MHIEVIKLDYINPHLCIRSILWYRDVPITYINDKYVSMINIIWISGKIDQLSFISNIICGIISKVVRSVLWYKNSKDVSLINIYTVRYYNLNKLLGIKLIIYKCNIFHIKFSF